jgi:type I restriction enzyme S subunit
MKLETFFQKFDQLADAPDAVATMRQLVLQLAVKGKLVERKRSDGNARSIFPEGRPCEVASRYEVAESWIWIRFATVGDQRLGKMLDQKGNRGELKPYLRNTNVQWMRFQLDDIKELRLETSELKEYRLVPGDLLICEGGEPGRCAIWRDPDREMYFQKAIHRVRPRRGILSEYLAICLQVDAQNGVLAKHFTGATIKHFTGRSLSEYSIPLPPLAEQKRIVKKVDELMAVCDRLTMQQQERETRHAALARASLACFGNAPTPANLPLLFHPSYDIKPTDLRKSILALAVQGKLVPQDPNDEPAEELIARIGAIRRAQKAKEYESVPADEVPFEVPFSWSWVRLGNVSLTSDSGWSPQCLPEARSETDWGVLKVSAVSWGVFKPEENKALPPGMASRPDCEVKSGDFLLSRANTEELVARSVVVDQTPPRLMMSDKIVRFTFPDEIERSFIHLANTSNPSRAYYARNASGTSSSMKNIGREVMCKLPIPLPPFAEQRRIVSKVEQLMALVDELERHLAASRATAANLLSALVAELTTQA